MIWKNGMWISVYCVNCLSASCISIIDPVMHLICLSLFIIIRHQPFPISMNNISYSTLLPSLDKLFRNRSTGRWCDTLSTELPLLGHGASVSYISLCQLLMTIIQHTRAVLLHLIKTINFSGARGSAIIEISSSQFHWNNKVPMRLGVQFKCIPQWLKL